MLLLLLVAASMGFALIGKRIRDRNARRAIVASIEKLEGQVVYHSQWDEITETINAQPTPRTGWISEWIDEISIDEVVAVTYNLNQFLDGFDSRFYGVKVDFPDESLSVLEELPRLQYLYLWGTAIQDQTLVHLTRLPRLSVLDLSDTKISDAGLVYLARLTSLKGLNISRTQITADGARRLCEALPRTAIVHVAEAELSALSVGIPWCRTKSGHLGFLGPSGKACWY